MEKPDESAPHRDTACKGSFLSEKLPACRTVESLAIVAPFYNEEAGAEVFYDRLVSALEPLGISLQFIFVDDGSSDRTCGVLNRIADRDTRVTVLSLARNFGHQIALTAGLDYAEADAVITMDGDLQHPPETIPDMLQQYEAGYDVVYAVRMSHDHRGWLKRIVARVFYATLSRTTKIDVISGAVDFRLMSREVVHVLRGMRETHRYLRGMVPWIGFPYSTVSYEQQSRHTGESKYGWRQLGRMARHGFFSFSTVPLDLITWLGVIVTSLSGLYLVVVVLSALFTSLRVELPGWTSIIAVLLIVSGVQLISIGIVAQYVGMIFEQVKNRPLYTLKQERLSQNDKPTPQLD